MGAVGDGAHALLHGDVLIGKAADPGEAAQLHGRAVLPVIDAGVLDLAIVGVEVDAQLAAGELAPGLLIDALARVGPGGEVDDVVGVVHRHAHLVDIVDIVGGNQHVEGRHEERHAHIVAGGGVLDGAAQGGVAEAVVGLLRLQAGRLVGGGPLPGGACRGGAVDAGRRHIRGMQAGGMGGIDGALKPLRPVAVDHDLQMGDAGGVARGEDRPLEGGHLLRRAHIGPDHAAAFLNRVGPVLHLLAEGAARRLGGHVDAIALHVEFPAVIEAAQAALFIAPEEEGGLAMGALLGH